jgi:hypothetical protein
MKWIFGRSSLPLWSWRNIRVVLIVGTGRTGSEFLASLFNDMYGGQVLALHEPKPDLLGISVEVRKNKWSSLRVIFELLKARAQYQKKCVRAGVRFYVESNNNLSFLLPWLRFVFPNVRVLFFTRDPESFLISEMNKRHGDTKFHLFGDDDHRARITADLIGEAATVEWNKWSRARKISWYWQACNRYVIEHLGGYKSMTIRFEDFFAPDKSASILESIIHFTGLPAPAKNVALDQKLSFKINSSKHSEFSGVADLPGEDRAEYDRMTSALKKKLGY